MSLIASVAIMPSVCSSSDPSAASQHKAALTLRCGSAFVIKNSSSVSRPFGLTTCPRTARRPGRPSRCLAAHCNGRSSPPAPRSIHSCETAQTGSPPSLFLAKVTIQIINANRVRPQPRHHRGAGGIAERQLAIRPIEAHALRGQSVQIRRPRDRIAIATQRARQIVNGNEKDVGAFLGGGCGPRNFFSVKTDLFRPGVSRRVPC